MALLIAAAIVHHRRKKAREQREAAEAAALLADPSAAPHLPQHLPQPPPYTLTTHPAAPDAGSLPSHPGGAVSVTRSGHSTAGAEPLPYWMPKPGHSEWEFPSKASKRGPDGFAPSGRPHSVRSLPYDRPSTPTPPSRPAPQPSPSKGNKGLRNVRNFLSSSSSRSPPQRTETMPAFPSPPLDGSPGQGSSQMGSRPPGWTEAGARIWEVGDNEDVVMDAEPEEEDDEADRRSSSSTSDLAA